MQASAAKQTQTDVRERAIRSLGTSGAAIYQMVGRAVESLGRVTQLADIGCGTGNLWPFVQPHIESYVGVDVFRYDQFPPGLEFRQVDLDTGKIPLADGAVQVAVAVETVEHLENPRAFLREMVRVTRPGGYVLVSTPNQLSLLSLLTLATKSQFSAFQATDYPAHITALLEIDLERMARECGLRDIRFEYSESGRVVFTSAHYPRWVSKLLPRRFSDNLLIVAQRPM